MKSRITLAAAAFVLAAMGAREAAADVDAQCYNDWNAALVTLQVGEKCKFLDGAGAEKVRKAQEQRMQCALAKATAAERAEMTGKTVPAAQKDSVAQVAAMQCGSVRGAFDAQVKALAK